MKKRLFFAFLIFCSACLPLSSYAQEGQSRPSLPPLSKQNIDPGKIEVNLPPTPVLAHGWPCHEDYAERANSSYTVVQDEPRVGSRIRGYPPIEPRPGTGTGYADGPEPRFKYRIIFDELLYDVTANEEGVIRRISTDDPRFKTPEGVAVGEPLAKALASSKRKPGKLKPCLYYVELKFGWNALFPPDKVTKDGAIAPDARVAAFFKER